MNSTGIDLEERGEKVDYGHSPANKEASSPYKIHEAGTHG
jgi:hypothetical protein